MRKKIVPRSADLPDQGSMGESIGDVMSKVGVPKNDAEKGMLRQHMKDEAGVYTSKRRKARKQDEFNRGKTRGQRMA